MWHLVLCSHLVLVWMAREGLMLVSSSVSTADTCSPAQGDLRGPLIPPWRHMGHPQPLPHVPPQGLRCWASALCSIPSFQD